MFPSPDAQIERPRYVSGDPYPATERREVLPEQYGVGHNCGNSHTTTFVAIASMNLSRHTHDVAPPILTSSLGDDSHDRRHRLRTVHSILQLDRFSRLRRL